MSILFYLTGPRKTITSCWNVVNKPTPNFCIEQGNKQYGIVNHDFEGDLKFVFYCKTKV